MERLDWEVRRGFRSIPKRGAEVGGLLLGTMEDGFPTVVRVENFEVIPCGYQYGPSFQLAEDDRVAFESAYERWQPEASPSTNTVGYFRSHTRDGLALDANDLAILNELFPDPSHVALLVRPHATEACTAGFFFREGGAFPQATPLEFPFGQPDLLSDDVAPPPPPPEEPDAMVIEMAAEPVEAIFPDRAVPVAIPVAAASSVPPLPVVNGQAQNGPAQPSQAQPSQAQPSQAQPRSGWLWIPLSFISMLVGVVVGFQAALTLETQATASGGNDYSLSLSVAQVGDKLNLHWDRQTTAIRSASKGILEIEERGYTKSVDLDGPQLQNGTLIYRNSTNAVRFRLTVYPTARTSVTESLSWKR
jgi:hypothetical protein